MFSSALHELFGGRAAEAVLLHLFHYGETHGRAVARDFAASLVSVQRQLERSGVLVCRRQGRTLVYSWNPKSRLAERLRDLVGVVYEGMARRRKKRFIRNGNCRVSVAPTGIHSIRMPGCFQNAPVYQEFRKIFRWIRCYPRICPTPSAILAKKHARHDPPNLL